jgi:hypothetical protein
VGDCLCNCADDDFGGITGYIYFLSKRTNIYTNVASAKGDAATRTTVFDIGMSHNF